MRKLLALIGIAAALPAAPLFAQAAGSAPSGATPDLRNSDMGAHDSATQPSDRDVMTRAILNDNLDRAAKARRDKLGPARAAKASEIIPGATVNDSDGVAIATVQAVAADGVVLFNGKAKVKVPADAFGRNKAGLLLDMPKAQFDQTVAKANAG
jgi:hypothetical protein